MLLRKDSYHENNVVQAANTIFILHKEYPQSVVYKVHNNRGHKKGTHARDHAIYRDNEDRLCCFVVNVS